MNFPTSFALHLLPGITVLFTSTTTGGEQEQNKTTIIRDTTVCVSTNLNYLIRNELTQAAGEASTPCCVPGQEGEGATEK